MKIIAFGEVMMRMMPLDYKLLSQTNTLEYLFTGTGVNVLAGLAQMGEDSYFVSTLPDNSVGEAASATLRSLKIKDDYLQYQGNHIGVYFLEKGIGNRASKVTYLNRKNSSFSLCNPNDYDYETILKDKDILHICGISLAINENTRNTALTFAKTAKKMGIKVVFDCNFRPTLWDEKDLVHAKQVYREMLTYADIVFATEKDAMLNFGYTSKLKDEKEIRKDVLTQMKDEFNIQVIAGTIREGNYLQGYYLDNQGWEESKNYTLTIYDRIGGGDAFAAGFIHGYLNMKDRQKAIEYATCSGVLGHTTYGDSPVLSKGDILDFMENGPSDVKR